MYGVIEPHFYVFFFQVFSCGTSIFFRMSIVILKCCSTRDVSSSHDTLRFWTHALVVTSSLSAPFLFDCSSNRNHERRPSAVQMDSSLRLTLSLYHDGVLFCFGWVNSNDSFAVCKQGRNLCFNYLVFLTVKTDVLCSSGRLLARSYARKCRIA